MPNQGGTHEQHVKAGQQSHKNNENRQQQAQDDNRRGQQQGGDHRGGSGNFADDRERASEAGRKGGQR